MLDVMTEATRSVWTSSVIVGTIIDFLDRWIKRGTIIGVQMEYTVHGVRSASEDRVNHSRTIPAMLEYTFVHASNKAGASDISSTGLIQF